MLSVMDGVIEIYARLPAAYSHIPLYCLEQEPADTVLDRFRTPGACILRPF